MAFQVRDQRWELAGFRDGRGRLDRPLQSDLLFIPPKIRLSPDSSNITWSVAGRVSRTRPDQDMLTAFCRLARSAAPAAFLRFAQKFGVFGAARLKADAPPFDDEIEVNACR